MPRGQLEDRQGPFQVSVGLWSKAQITDPVTIFDLKKKVKVMYWQSAMETGHTWPF